MAIFVRYCFQVLHLFSFFFGSLARRVLTDMPHDSLPLAIVEFMGWLTIPIVAFISYGILGVVCNAAELEDPFGSGEHLTSHHLKGMKSLRQTTDRI